MLVALLPLPSPSSFSFSLQPLSLLKPCFSVKPIWTSLLYDLLVLSFEFVKVSLASRSSDLRSLPSLFCLDAFFHHQLNGNQVIALRRLLSLLLVALWSLSGLLLEHTHFLLFLLLPSPSSFVLSFFSPQPVCLLKPCFLLKSAFTISLLYHLPVFGCQFVKISPFDLSFPRPFLPSSLCFGGFFY